MSGKSIRVESLVVWATFGAVVVATLALAVALPTMQLIDGCVRSEVWPTSLIWFHVAANASVSIAYKAIPATLIWIIRKRRDIPFNWIVLLFAAFITLCGITHDLKIVSIWHPIYWLTTEADLLTGEISILTAVALQWKVAPILMTLHTDETVKQSRDEALALADSLAASNAELLAEREARGDQSRLLERSNAALREERDRALRLTDELDAARKASSQRADTAEEMLQKIRERDMTIDELSTPVLAVADGVVLASVVGALDSRRAAMYRERLLTAASQNSASEAIIDVTGVPVVDTAVAQEIMHTAGALRLLGASCYLTGIGPHVATTIVQIGAEAGLMHSVHTPGSLRKGIAMAIQARRSKQKEG